MFGANAFGWPTFGDGPQTGEYVPIAPIEATPDVVIDVRPTVGFIEVRATAQIIEVEP